MSSRAFSHGHTYQGHPVACAAALEVQRIIRDEKLVDNVREQGILLENLLHGYLDDHPYVGNVRGKGLFWGVSIPFSLFVVYVIANPSQIEFVADKKTKEPFSRSLNVAQAVNTKAFEDFKISLYPGNGTKDGTLGDHVLISPAYNSTAEEIQEMAVRTRDAIYATFEDLGL